MGGMSGAGQMRRKVLGVAGGLLVVAAGTVLVVAGGDRQAAASTSSSTPPSSTIAVSGKASVSLPEDQATFSVTVQEQGSSAAVALSSDDQVMGKVLSALQNAGATQSDIATSGLSVYPQYDRQKLNDFEASNTVQVKVTTLADLGAWIDAAVNAGATNVGSVSLTASNAKSVEDQALAQAMADAKQKAAALAQSGDLTLGTVQSISEQSSSPVPEPIFAATSLASTPIEAGNQTVTVTVQVTYQATPIAG